MTCNGIHRWAVCTKGADEEGFGPEPIQCTSCGRYQFNYGQQYMDEFFNPQPGEFVTELLVTDTVVYQVISSTAKSLVLQRTFRGARLKIDRHNPYVTYDQAMTYSGIPPEGARELQTRLRRRQDGTFRRRKRANAIGPALYVRDVPVTRTDYSF